MGSGPLPSEDDTEFHAEGTYYPRLALIQLAIPGRVAVIDATAVDPRQLAPLFAGAGVAVIHAGGRDIEIIERACGARPTRVFDTQIAAGFLGYSTPAPSTLVTDFLGLTLDKGQQTSDCFRRPLSREQIAYAEADVAHLLELRAVLEARLADLGRLPWAVEESGRLTLPRTPDDDTAWWRLKGAHRRPLARIRRLPSGHPGRQGQRTSVIDAQTSDGCSNRSRERTSLMTGRSTGPNHWVAPFRWRSTPVSDR